MRERLIIVLLFVSINSIAQQIPTVDSLRSIYSARQKVLDNNFANFYYPNRPQIYSLIEMEFVYKIDSVYNIYQKELNNYNIESHGLDTTFIQERQREVQYYFDNIILDYPYYHETYTGNKVQLSKPVQLRLDKHLNDFNNLNLLSTEEVKGYIGSFLRHKSSEEIKKAAYAKIDNKRLNAYLTLIPQYFTNKACRDFWQYNYIYSHLDNFGSKNLEKIVTSFLASCQNASYKNTIDSMYAESVKARNGHLIKTYKTVDGYDLDIHLFLPDGVDKSKKSQVMVFFFGGSWTIGTPEWEFYNCSEYAKKGWVGVSVEYRLADRHETTPFESVKDARSAIRWLRMNAELYNIDANRIVVSGNSAGGHLALTTALADDWNENSDDLNYSAVPNLLLVNSGVYNLFEDKATSWITRDLKDKNIVKKISPYYLVKKGLSPMLIIHGTNDKNVDYSYAKAFAEEMKKMGNDFEFQTLEGAPHFIWYDQRYSSKVADLRKNFLKKYGYE